MKTPSSSKMTNLPRLFSIETICAVVAAASLLCPAVAGASPRDVPEIQQQTVDTHAHSHPHTQAHNWTPYTSEDGRFSVVYPGPPSRELDGIEVEGGTLMMNTTFVEIDEGAAAFIVISIDYSGLEHLSRDAMLDATVASLKATYNDSQAVEKRVRSGKYEGRELHLRSGSTLNMSVRVFFVNGVGYHVMVSSSPGHKVNKNDIARFLDSFRIK